MNPYTQAKLLGHKQRIDFKEKIERYSHPIKELLVFAKEYTSIIGKTIISPNQNQLNTLKEKTLEGAEAILMLNLAILLETTIELGISISKGIDNTKLIWLQRGLSYDQKHFLEDLFITQKVLCAEYQINTTTINFKEMPNIIHLIREVKKCLENGIPEEKIYTALKKSLPAHLAFPLVYRKEDYLQTHYM